MAPRCIGLALAATAVGLLTSCSATVAVGGAWELVWEDDFNGTTINTTNWNVYDHWSQLSNQIELYMADDAFLDGQGNLVLRTRPRNITYNGHTFNVTSGRVDSAQKLNFTYGRFEIRTKLQNPAAYGIHTAFWLLGYACWPTGGEIDVFEHETELVPGHNLSVRATSTYHWGERCGVETPHGSGVVSNYPNAPWGSNPVSFNDTYHTFAVEWNSTDIVTFVDDVQVNHLWENMPVWPGLKIADWPMYMLISQAYMLHRPTETPSWVWPVEQHVDWVRVYQWNATAGEKGGASTMPSQSA